MSASASVVAIPIDAEYGSVEKQIEAYLLHLFLKFKQTDIPGNLNMNIEVQAHSGARELEIKYKCTVGDYTNQQSFTSNSMTTSLKKSCERFQEQRQHRVLAIAATEEMPF